jgi:hypothetical protein
LPVALFTLAALGMFMGGRFLKERIKGIDSYAKLLTIPLFMIHFRVPTARFGFWPHSCSLERCCLAASGLILVSPRGEGWGLAKTYGVPVKDYISQSVVFTICAFGLFYLAIDAFRLRLEIVWRPLLSARVSFLADMFFVCDKPHCAFHASVFAFAARIPPSFGWKGHDCRLCRGRGRDRGNLDRIAERSCRIAILALEINRQQTENIETPAGARLDFWKRTAGIYPRAPIFGHGTGSIRESFQKSAIGQGASVGGAGQSA